MKRLRKDVVRTGLVAIAAALGLAACGSGGSTPAAGTSTSGGSGQSASSSIGPGASTIVAAAARSAEAPGGKVKMIVVLDTSALGDLQLSGAGTYDNAQRSGALALTLSLPSDGSLVTSFLSGAQVNVITHDTTVDVELPSDITELLSSYTGGKPWITANLGQLATNKSIGGLADLLNSDGGITNPIGSVTNLLKGAAADFKKVGPKTIDGVATTEYRAQVNLADLESSLPAAARAQLKQVTGASKVPYEIFIDGSGRIRRIAFALEPTVDGVKTGIAFQTDVTSYGAEPAPKLPAAGQTANVTRLIGALG